VSTKELEGKKLFYPSLFTLHSKLFFVTDGNSPNAMGSPLPGGTASKAGMGERELFIDMKRIIYY
jgi:hypothetical protein